MCALAASLQHLLSRVDDIELLIFGMPQYVRWRATNQSPKIGIECEPGK